MANLLKAPTKTWVCDTVAAVTANPGYIVGILLISNAAGDAVSLPDADGNAIFTLQAEVDSTGTNINNAWVSFAAENKGKGRYVPSITISALDTSAVVNILMNSSNY